MHEDQKTLIMLHVLICTSLLMIFAQQSHAQSSRLSKASSPTPANIPGYFKAHCVSLPQGIRICKGLSDSENPFVLEKDGTRMGSWPGIAQLGETSDFEVLQGDLDDDGQPELIVANLDSTSTGIAINVWTIAIFSAGDVSSFRAPLTFSVEEYGSFGTFVSRGKQVELLATRWLWASDPKRRRGTGLYLVGQWWRYVRGELVRSTNRTIVARRFLESFAMERDRTIDSPAKPFKWLTGPRAETFPVDPILSLKTESVTEGVITNVSAETTDERRTLKIEFTPDGGAPVSFIYPQTDADDVKSLTDIGDSSTKRVYPLRYIPTSPDRWLKARRASTITYNDDKRRILWLKPKSN